MKTLLTIGGVTYDGGATASGRPAAGIFDVGLTISVEEYWSLTFEVLRCGPGLPFVPGVEVTLDVTADDGTGRRTVFKGDLQRPEARVTERGMSWGYSCTDMKRRGDYVTVSGLDGSGVASFNLSPDDPLALYATSGMTVAGIIQAILEYPGNAEPLSALGVGNYASLSPPALPAITLADLAALTVVPAEPVQLDGESIFVTLEQFLIRWHPQYGLWVMPDGTIRVRSIFALDRVPVALPSNDGTGDDVDWPEFTGPDCSSCFTAWEIRGLDIQTAYLSVHDGTLSPAWSTANQSAWTISDFLQPKGAVDEGTASGVTSVSVVVHSDQARTHWGTNYWNGPDVLGWIYLSWPAGSGIELYETRQITSCTAMAAGGTATITWDPGLPINGTSYTRYRLVGTATPLGLVGREFHVREPATGAIDRDTFVGSHMYPRNPKGMPVANSSRVFDVFYPYAFVQWSRTGAWPWWEIPVNVQINPRTGRIVLTEPAVIKSAGLAGAQQVLASRYPTSFADGLFYDVKVVIPFNRGALAARAPALGSGGGGGGSGPGWSPDSWTASGMSPSGWDPSVAGGGGGGGGTGDYTGTAFTKYGIQRTKVQHLDSFTWLGDTPALANLAAERLAVVCNAVVEGSIRWHGIPASFDAFTPGIYLDVSVSGGTHALAGLPLPVRTASIRWHDEGGDIYTVDFRFSTLKRPFEGDSLYIHPTLGQNTFGMQGGDVFVGGMVGGDGGMMGTSDYARLGAQSAADFRDSMPEGRISAALSGGGEAPDIGDIDSMGASSSGFSGGRRQSRKPEGPMGPPAPAPSVSDAMLAKAREANPAEFAEPPAPPAPVPARRGGLAERRGQLPDDDDTTIGAG